jgi:hypothetical protein
MPAPAQRPGEETELPILYNNTKLTLCFLALSGRNDAVVERVKRQNRIQSGAIDSIATLDDFFLYSVVPSLGSHRNKYWVKMSESQDTTHFTIKPAGANPQAINDWFDLDAIFAGMHNSWTVSIPECAF